MCRATHHTVRSNADYAVHTESTIGEQFLEQRLIRALCGAHRSSLDVQRSVVIGSQVDNGDISRIYDPTGMI